MCRCLQVARLAESHEVVFMPTGGVYVIYIRFLIQSTQCACFRGAWYARAPVLICLLSSVRLRLRAKNSVYRARVLSVGISGLRHHVALESLFLDSGRHDGKQLFTFGSIPVYLDPDKKLVYAKTPKRGFQPTSLSNLVQSATTRV